MKKAILHMVLGLRMTQLQHPAYWGIWKILIITTMKKQTLDGTDFDTKFALGEVTMDGHINDCVNKWCTLVEKGLIASESLGISCQEMLNSFKNGEKWLFFMEVHGSIQS